MLSLGFWKRRNQLVCLVMRLISFLRRRCNILVARGEAPGRMILKKPASQAWIFFWWRFFCDAMQGFVWRENPILDWFYSLFFKDWTWSERTKESKNEVSTLSWNLLFHFIFIGLFLKDIALFFFKFQTLPGRLTVFSWIFRSFCSSPIFKK